MNKLVQLKNKFIESNLSGKIDIMLDLSIIVSGIVILVS